MQSRQTDLTINKMTKAQYNAITPNADEIYLITDDNGLTQSDITTALGYTPVNPTSLATVATTGSYNDLADKPYIPSGVVVDQTYDPTSTNAQSGVAINGAGFLTSSSLNGYATQSWVTSQGYTTNTGTVTSVNSVQPVNGNVTLSIPSVGNGTVTFTQGGVTKGSITMNQSGNTTINFDASSTGGIQNTATGTDSLTILGTPATYGNSINIGSGSSVQNAYSTAIGNNSSAAKFASALGYSSVASANGSIQLGYGTNSTADTFNVGFYKSVNPVNYQLLDGTTGLIPDSRLSSNIARTSQLTTPTYDSTNERITW